MSYTVPEALELVAEAAQYLLDNRNPEHSGPSCKPGAPPPFRRDPTCSRCRLDMALERLQRAREVPSPEGAPAAGKIDVGRWVMRDSDEETGVPFWYCDYCDNSGDALLTVAHSADCPVGALAALAGGARTP